MESLQERKVKYLPYLEAAIKVLSENAGPAWVVQALKVDEYPFNLYYRNLIHNFMREEVVSFGMLPLEPVTEHTYLYSFDKEDVDRFCKKIVEWYKATQPRRDLLWKLYCESNAVFTKEVEVRHFQSTEKSLGRAMATARSSNYSEGGESYYYEVVTYFVGSEKLTSLEYDWLRSKTREVQIPKGYYRVPDELNTLKEIFYPKDKYHLRVWGKTGPSRRGVDPTGDLYQGPPEKCNIHPEYRWAWKWFINGERIQPYGEGYWTNWNVPLRRAQRAFEEAGLKPIKGEAEALAEAYQREESK